MKNKNHISLDDVLNNFPKISTSDILYAQYQANIVAAIEKKRISLNLTPEEFVRNYNLNMNAYQKMLNSNYDFSLSELVDIAKKLNLKLSIKLKET